MCSKSKENNKYSDEYNKHCSRKSINMMSAYHHSTRSSLQTIPCTTERKFMITFYIGNSRVDNDCTKGTHFT
jgi:hypothetical protein